MLNRRMAIKNKLCLSLCGRHFHTIYSFVQRRNFKLIFLALTQINIHYYLLYSMKHLSVKSIIRILFKLNVILKVLNWFIAYTNLTLTIVVSICILYIIVSHFYTAFNLNTVVCKRLEWPVKENGHHWLLHDSTYQIWRTPKLCSLDQDWCSFYTPGYVNHENGCKSWYFH